MLFHQLIGFSSMSLGPMQLGLLIFIFHFFGNSAEACQPCTTNKSHWIGGNNAKGYLALFGPVEPP